MKFTLKYLIIILFIILLSVIFLFSFQIIRWKAYIWFPSYIGNKFNSERNVEDSSKHLIFIMVDHYEPGFGQKGVDINNTFLAKLKTIADKHTDSYGNRFKYSFFYPFDHHNQGVLSDLSKAVFNNNGEIELHWHHPQANNEIFPGMVRECIDWFNKYGAFRGFNEDGDSFFAFIHGNWAVDDSRGWVKDGKKDRCGVTREIEILHRSGCYGDFTFPAFGTKSQPAKVNSIYYATDTEKRKSYNTGTDAEVGKKPKDSQFLLFEGPLGINFTNFEFEYSGVESYTLPSTRRIKNWIKTNIHVKGKPEWVFVKVYSHGIQSQDEIVNKYLDIMLTDLKKICDIKKIKLHYFSAREAVNLVKAAENNQNGDPEKYRDYYYPPRCNQYFNTTLPVTIHAMSRDTISIEIDSLSHAMYQFNDYPFKTVKGTIRYFKFSRERMTIECESKDSVTIFSDSQLTVIGSPHKILIRD